LTIQEFARVAIVSLLVVIPVRLVSADEAAAFDLVIANGHVIDGTGSPWYSADIGIRAGRVAAIGSLAGNTRARTIDARGMVVAPGFIDMLGQSERTILVDPRLPSKIYQGITTEITGEGDSPAPQNDAVRKAMQHKCAHLHIECEWSTLRQYYARLEKQGIGINIATYVGATQVREMVLGFDDVQPNESQLEAMKQLVREGMWDGAIGVSTSLEYPPAPYAKTDELIALATEAAPYGGIYATHMRSEGDAITQALEETLRIGREAHIPVEIWHLKVAGKENWGRMGEVLTRLNAARTAGVDVTADTYAYTAWSNDLSAFIPPWAHDGGKPSLVARLQDPATRARIRKELLTPATSWDNEWNEISGPQDVMITSVQNPKLVQFQGKRLTDIAAAWHVDPMDALFDFLVADNAYAYCAVFGMSEADVSLALQQPWVSINNDSEGASPEGLLGRDHPHPRAYGTFPRILRKYVREEHKLTLEDAIRKFAALPAQRLRLADRGVLKEQMWADIVVFDPATVRDLATYENPNQLSQGMQFVLVNGALVIDGGAMTGQLPGKVLRGAGYKP
jgi:N-acyl-D-amino-acid deacylase